MLADRERNDSSAKIAPLTPNGSHMKVTKKQLFGIPEPSILTKKRSTETPKLNDTYDDNIDIQLLDRLLTAHSLGPMDTYRISERLYLSPEKSSELIQFAASIERKSGFRIYRAHSFIDDPILNTVTEDLSEKPVENV